MKIAIGGLVQETNTCSQRRTTIEDFQRYLFLEAEEVTEKMQPTRTEVGGFIASALENGDKIYGTMAAWSNPSGRLDSSALDELLGKLDCHKDVFGESDALLFALHGALASEIEDDVEGCALKQLRAHAGEKQIVCSLDMHANVTDQMIENAYFVGYRTYPHRDAFETGQRSYGLLKWLSNKADNLAVLFAKLPMLLPVHNAQTTSGVMADCIRTLKEYERAELIVSGSIFTPHPWLDIKDVGLAIYFIVEKEHLKTARLKLDDLSKTLWAGRHEFLQNCFTIECALAKIREQQSPVLFIDSGDVVSAGSDGQSTFMIEGMLKYSEDLRVVMTICEPAVIKTLNGSALNELVNVTFGEEASVAPHRRPVEVQAKFIYKTDASYVMKGAFYTDISINCGIRYVLSIDSTTIIVTEYPDFASEPEFYKSEIYGK